MKTSINAQFIWEMQTYNLRYKCCDCAHYKPREAQTVEPNPLYCSLLYPYGENRCDIAEGDVIEFCKEFESL